MKAGTLLIGLLLTVHVVFAGDKPHIGDPAPTFFLRSLDGETFFLSRQVGAKASPETLKPLVLSFFATWCVPCKAEIPVLHRIQEEHPEVRFYLVNVEEEADLVKQYVTANGVRLPILMDMYSVVAKKYGIVNSENIAVLPQLVLIDAAGNLVYAHEGYQAGDETELQAKLHKLLQ